MKISRPQRLISGLRLQLGLAVTLTPTLTLILRHDLSVDLHRGSGTVCGPVNHDVGEEVVNWYDLRQVARLGLGWVMVRARVRVRVRTRVKVTIRGRVRVRVNARARLGLGLGLGRNDTGYVLHGRVRPFGNNIDRSLWPGTGHKVVGSRPNP